MVGTSRSVMRETFNPTLQAHELPRQTLVDLWRRTARAHEKLCETWFAAVAEGHGPEVADAIAQRGWPLKRSGATWKELFFDDLRFVVAATELKPNMLTVADRDQAETPHELAGNRSWFQLLVSFSRLRDGKPHSKRSAPAWTGSPGRVRGHARGKGIELGFAILLKAWQLSQGTHASKIDAATFEKEVSNVYDEKTLALLWNYAALAYMLATDRWYTGVRRKFGQEAAQTLEKQVWIDRGAAEHDLQIGQAAMGVTGNDVESLLRSFQFAPGEVGVLDVEFELIDSNYGIITHRACPALDRFEHFDEDRLRHCCSICLAGMPISGQMLNRNIVCEPLKLPPRVDSDDIACRWEYRLDCDPLTEP
ncbi:MAG: hypothetical protein WBM46_03940 [Polyangiales bacterium]|jgi:hypothetical protein